MKYRFRKKKTETGVQVALVFDFTHEQYEMLPQLSDDPNLDWSYLRNGGPDTMSKVDQALCWMRIICYWIGLFDRDDDTARDILTNAAMRRKALTTKRKTRRKKRK